MVADKISPCMDFQRCFEASYVTLTQGRDKILPLAEDLYHSSYSILMSKRVKSDIKVIAQSHREYELLLIYTYTCLYSIVVINPWQMQMGSD